MAIRQNYITHDILKCVHALVNKLCSTTSPWTSWTALKGFPESDVFTDFSKPLIYLEDPVLAGDRVLQQGASKRTKEYSMIVGVWDDRKTGGQEEIQMMTSYLMDYFNDPYSCMNATFDVTLAATNSDTTLYAQGVVIEGINGPRIVSTEDTKEFRREFDLRIIA